jgi:hypothetical protein
MSGIARFLVSIGLALVVGGLLWHFLGGRIPFGKLPGDIVIRRPGYTMVIPLGTCIALSLLLTLLTSLWRWFGRR